MIYNYESNDEQTVKKAIKEVLHEGVCASYLVNLVEKLGLFQEILKIL